MIGLGTMINSAAIVAGGAIALSALSQKGIEIGTHIYKLSDIEDKSFEDCSSEALLKTVSELNKKTFPELKKKFSFIKTKKNIYKRNFVFLNNIKTKTEKQIYLLIDSISTKLAILNQMTSQNE